MSFPFQSWPVYKDALELRRLARKLGRRPPAQLASDLDQFRRCSSSVVLNITEAAGHFTPGKKLDRYRTALGSVYECAGVCDLLREEPGFNQADVKRATYLCDSIAAQLTGLIKSIQDRTTEKGKREEPSSPPSPPPQTSAPAP